MPVGRPLKYQTVEELQALIASLQEQILTLTAQLADMGGSGSTGGTSIAACSGITFSRSLALGSTGSDVKCLQALLNSNVATQVAASGVGSPGNETSYFGNLTKAGVVKFQEVYASEVLTQLD